MIASRNSQLSYLVTNPSTSYRRTCSSSAYNNCCPVVAPAYAVRCACVPPKRRKSSNPSGVRLNITPIRRSEENTSELQSRGHLVCRLLLEKKKNKTEQSSKHI